MHPESLPSKSNDPSISSAVEEQLAPRHTFRINLRGREKYRDPETKEEYFKIPQNKHPRLQRFVSLLLKGTINTCDVIEKDGKYFSHIQKEPTIKTTIEDAKVEMIVGAYLLDILLDDHDHRFRVNEPKGKNGWIQRRITDPHKKHGWLEQKNVHLGVDNDKINFYDFDKAQNFKKFNQIEAENKLNELINKFSFGENTKQQILNSLNAKIDHLLANEFSEEKGPDFFKSVLARSRVTIDQNNSTGFPNYTFSMDSSDDRSKEIFDDLRQRVLFIQSNLI